MRLHFTICCVFAKIAMLVLQSNAQYDLNYLDARNPYDFKTKFNGAGLVVRPQELPRLSMPTLQRPRYFMKQFPSLLKPLKPIGGPCSCKATVVSPAIVPKPGSGYSYGQRADTPKTSLLQKLSALFGYPGRALSPPAFVLPPQSLPYENPPSAMEAPSAPSYNLPPPSISLQPSIDGAAAPSLVLPPSGRSPAQNQYGFASGRGILPLQTPYALPSSGRGAPQQDQYLLTPPGQNSFVLRNPYAQAGSGVPNGASGSPWSSTSFIYPTGGSSPSLVAPGQQLSPSAVTSGVPSGLQGTYASYPTNNAPSSGTADPVPVPSDPVSMQLALNAREQALKKVVDDELSFGFKTMPTDGAIVKPVRDVPEEKLQQMKGVVVALQPASYVEVPKSVDEEAADSFLPEKMIVKSRTQLVIPSKKPTLGEMGYAPAIIHPPPTSSVPIPASPQTTFDVPGAPSSSGTCNDHIPGQVMSGTAPKSETYVHPAPPAPPCNSAEEHGEQEQTGAAYPSYAGYSK